MAYYIETFNGAMFTRFLKIKLDCNELNWVSEYSQGSDYAWHIWRAYAL